METGRVLLWVLGGSVVVGGIAYVVASKKTASTAAAAPNPSDPCAQAAKMAALATSDPANASDFSGPYHYWADLCRSQGGSPPPFPT